MDYFLKNEDIENYNDSDVVHFPKYTSQLINLANQNAQGTRSQIVGQVSDLFPEFQQSGEMLSIENWANWYLDRYPNAIDIATEKIIVHVDNLSRAIGLIDRDMIRSWVENLVITKTFNGLYMQRAILASVSEIQDAPYRLASPLEESRGIDGYVGDVPYSIKPDTYRIMGRLPESINAKMVYYTKTKAGLRVEVVD